MRLGSREHRPAVSAQRARAGRAARVLVLLLAAATPLIAQGDCRTWFQRSAPAPLPSPRGEYGLAWDSDRARTVLFGGAANLGFTAVNKELWEWDGQAWSQIAFAGGPVQRCDHVQAYDPDRDVLVIFGGFNGSYLSDSWEWDGAAWTSQPGGPGARADAFMVYEAARLSMVMFGGLAPGSVNLGDTWVRFGPFWAPQLPLNSPSPRWIQRMAYDSDAEKTVLFGGAATAGVLGDTWEWNGIDWVNAATSGAGPRYGHAMAYDTHRHVTLMFGGQDGNFFGVGLLGDTWQWDGLAWVQLQTPGPPARSFVKMAYDTARRRVVLFGSYTAAGFANDTWEFGAYPDCNADGALTVADFGCFQTAFVNSDLYADCTRDSQLTVADFGCFQTKFVQGCP